MLIHAITIAQSCFTITVTSALLFLIKKNRLNDRRKPASYVNLWLLSYVILSLMVGILIDFHRDLEYFWALLGVALFAFILGDIALWKSVKSILDSKDKPMEK